jgi:Fe-S-cluster containining protein
MNCRPGCGACCIAPSINSHIPGMPHGKPAGQRCVQLDDNNGCKLFDSPQRPEFCAGLRATVEMCRDNRDQAMAYLSELEQLTRP